MEEKIVLIGSFGAANVKGKGNFTSVSGFDFYIDIPPTADPSKLYKVSFALRPVAVTLFNRPGFSYLPGKVLNFELVKP